MKSIVVVPKYYVATPEVAMATAKCVASHMKIRTIFNLVRSLKSLTQQWANATLVITVNRLHMYKVYEFGAAHSKTQFVPGLFRLTIVTLVI